LALIPITNRLYGDTKHGTYKRTNKEAMQRRAGYKPILLEYLVSGFEEMNRA
jgi:hypothetical protein